MNGSDLKALLSSSEHYEFAAHAAAAHGIGIGQLSLDLATMLKRKDEVVGQNTKGIEFLFRKNKITWAKGFGTLEPGNVVTVTEGGGAGGSAAGPSGDRLDRRETELHHLEKRRVRLLRRCAALELPNRLLARGSHRDDDHAAHEASAAIGLRAAELEREAVGGFVRELAKARPQRGARVDDAPPFHRRSIDAGERMFLVA